MDLREIPDHKFRRHPWETSRANFFKNILKSRGGDSTLHVLDVGAGDGWLTEQLLNVLPDAKAVCWDTNYRLEDLISQPERINFTSERPDKRFDAIFLLDILEHIKEDNLFLSELIESCAEPEALVLISVPAWSKLYSSHDTVFTHHRRYNPKTLKNLIEASGLTIISEGGLFHGLLPPRALTVLREKLFGPTQYTPKPLFWNHGDTSARAIEKFLAIDTKFSELTSKYNITVPGLSHWALCKKKKMTV